MDILSVLSEEEILVIIDRVALKQSKKPHGIYGIDDLQQFSRMVCWTKLPQFDFSRRKEAEIPKALENWLSRVIKNRLINLHRDTSKDFDKPFKKDADEFQVNVRNSLLKPISLSVVSSDAVVEDHDFQNINYMRSITKCLDEEYIEILDCYLSGFSIPSYYRDKLLKKIKTIIENMDE